MISETARPDTPAGGRQRRWARGAGRLARLLVIIGTLALLGTLLAAAVPRLWGYQSYVIYGNSMEPAIKVGSLILAKPANVDDLQVEDIIVFRSPGNAVTLTHRIVSIREEDGQRYFQTKGDASNGGDPQEVLLEGGVHRLAFKLPYLGYFVDFAKSGPGLMLLLILPAAALLLSYWSKHRRLQPQAEAAVVPPES